MLDSEDLPAIIFLAEDISEGIETRILSKAKKRSVPVFRFLAKETLGHVVGKGERSVVGLKKSAIAETRITSYNVCYTKLLRHSAF